jgi:hypothetical protein
VQLTVQIPDDLAQRLSAAGGDLSRRALEAFAADEYRNGQLTKPELRRLLDIEDRYELEGFLKAHGVCEEPSAEEIEREVDALVRLGF